MRHVGGLMETEKSGWQQEKSETLEEEDEQ